MGFLWLQLLWCFFSFVRILSYLIINRCLSLLRDTTPLTHHSTSVQFPPYASQLLRRRPHLIPLLSQAQPTGMLRTHPIPERPLIGEVGTWSQRPTAMVAVPDPRCAPRCDDQRLKLFDKMFIYSVDATTPLAYCLHTQPITAAQPTNQYERHNRLLLRYRLKNKKRNLVSDCQALRNQPIRSIGRSDRRRS